MDPKTLAYQVGLAGFVTDRNVAGVSHEESLKQPPQGGNCLNWNLGHLVRARLAMLQVLGADAAYSLADYDAYENAPITTGTQAKGWDVLLTQYRALQGPLKSALGGVTAERLAARAPFSPTNNPDETVGSLLAGFMFHEAYHAGQIALGRRLVGKAGAIGAPATASA